MMNISTNGSGNDAGHRPPIPADVDWIWACKVVIVVVGLVGNVLVIATVLSSRRLRSQSTYVLICSLSIVIMYALVVVVPFDINSTIVGSWPDHLHPKFCAFNAVSAMFFYGSTALNTAMIVLERYFATVWYGHTLLNSSSALVAMLVVCYAGPLLCLIPFFVHVHSGFSPVLMSCFITGAWKYDRFAWTVAFLVISLLIMIYCFGHIFIDLCRRKHTLLLAGEDPVTSECNPGQATYFNEMKTVKIAVVLFLLMLLRVPSLLAPFIASRSNLFVAINSTLILGLSAIMFYPIVYVLLCAEFRGACADLVCCWRATSKKHPVRMAETRDLDTHV